MISDPAKPNISDALADYCEGLGITMIHTAAEAHWQNGKVERHGQWFEQIHNRICDQVKPETPEEFVECVQQAQIAKNSLISVSGASPFSWCLVGTLVYHKISFRKTLELLPLK